MFVALGRCKVLKPVNSIFALFVLTKLSINNLLMVDLRPAVGLQEGWWTQVQSMRRP